jgi:hypothetical protein
MENGQKYSAPYLPFKTFLTGLDHLATITIPSKIELSTFYDMSGHNRAQMVSALKFFKLVDKEGHPQPGLSELAHNKNDRAQLIRGLLETFYPDVIALDLSKTTPSQLDKALDGAAYNVTGDTKKKAKTFLLGAAQFAGYKPHTLLTKITRNRRKGAAKQATGTAGSGKTAQADDNGGIPAEALVQPPAKPRGSEKTVQLKSGAGSVTLSIDVDLLELEPGEERDFVLKLRDMFRAYEKGLTVSTESNDKVEKEAGA